MHPLVLSTWSFGPIANRAGLRSFAGGGSALDAVIAAATAVEDDPTVDSVGTGGVPDGSGRVSLDACVMTDPNHCGSICFVRDYPNPAQIARRVMEKTIHVMLAGDGAEAFAAREGFTKRELLLPAQKSAWEKWRATAGEAALRGAVPPMNVEERYRDASPSPPPSSPSPLAPRPQSSRRGAPLPHDTVCILARDPAGQLAGACTTSGLGYKLPGRVGDSPIIGHGLYVDQQAGAAAATGNGELIMGVCGSFLAVELMRQGRTPAEALREVITRISQRYAVRPEHQAALIALRPEGAWASGSLRPGFSHCITDGDGATGTRVEPGQWVLDPS